MNTLAGVRIFGVLVTMALAIWAVGRELQNVEWKHRIRVVMEERPEKQGRVRNLWRQYLLRIKAYQSILDKPYQAQIVSLHVLALFLLFFGITLLLHYFFVIGLFVSGGLSLFLYDKFWSSRARKRREEITAAWLYEAVPIAVHVMTATQRLDQAIVRMTQMTHNVHLKAKLVRLSEVMRAPQFATPEDAFVFWASDMGIRDIEYFALATKEATKYNVPIEQLWIDMADLLGKDLEYKRAIRAQTAHHRSGGYIFYGMLAGTFLVAYPFAAKFMTESTRVLFWAVIGVMTIGLYLIMRESQRIDA